MTVPFMRAYTELLVRTCHRRGAHAMGGMAAFVPSRRDADVNATATAKVREDKEREVGDGFDGTWVAHPDLVPIAREVFSSVLGDAPHQKSRLRDDVSVASRQLLDVAIDGGRVTAEGVRANVRIALEYLDAWLRGSGAVAINNLMEDAATAEISRAQLWQWIRHHTRLDDGTAMSAARYADVRERELAALLDAQTAADGSSAESSRLRDAAMLLDELVLGTRFPEFLTLAGYRMLTASRPRATRLRAATDSKVVMHAAELAEQWRDDERWNGTQRDYSAEEVVRLRGSVRIEYTLARMGARRLWEMLRDRPYVHTFGALTGAQAVQMVKAGLEAIYLSGWQVAADGNTAGQTYPDQSIYPVNSVPQLVKRLNNALLRADQVEWSEGKNGRQWLVPIVADAEAGFGGPIHAFELTKAMIEAGAAGVHFEDQLASEKKCGHMGGKVLVPTSQFVRTLSAARLAADVLDVPTLIIARTDALAATLLTSDIDERDRRFVKGSRTPEGYFQVTGGLESAISRALAYAPYADLVWCETGTPDLEEARRFAEGVHERFPDRMLAYNCSPSFNWQRNLDAHTIAKFQRELGAMGYRFQFITLAGWHLLNLGTFELAHAYRDEGMPAYVRVQEREFARERDGYTATKHQREAGTGYFDRVLNTVSGGQSSTGALAGSTEEEQFESSTSVRSTSRSEPAEPSQPKRATVPDSVASLLMHAEGIAPLGDVAGSVEG
jgi:malate synthase